MPAAPRPLAVGLMQLSAGATQRDRSRMRIALAMKAADEGYALLETYETGSYGLRDEMAMAAMRQLAAKFKVLAVVHAGDVRLGPVREALGSLQVRYFTAS